MRIKENEENTDVPKIEEKGSILKNLISDYKVDILQRSFGAKSGKPLLFQMIVICFASGLIGKFLFKQSLLYSFFYPFVVTALATVVYIPLKLISFKSPKVAQILAGFFSIVFFAFFALIFLLLIILPLNRFFHFWF